MSRYSLPDPKCRHAVSRAKPRARVSSHAGSATVVPVDEPYASTWVCGRDECIEDAKEWVYASTHRTPVVDRREAAGGGSAAQA